MLLIAFCVVAILAVRLVWLIHRTRSRRLDSNTLNYALAFGVCAILSGLAEVPENSALLFVLPQVVILVLVLRYDWRRRGYEPPTSD